jgi:hypothetical protein
MASQASQVSQPHTAAIETLLRIAESELNQMLLVQERPMAGMYTQPSMAANAAVRRAAHVLCEEAHRLDLRAEELLIALKQAWAQLATTRARHLGERDGDVLREIVTTSIEVFFELHPPSPQDRH